MSRALLDVNVLLGLLDRQNPSHETARDWLSREVAHGWASCAITQNGYIRVVSQSRYPNPITPTHAIGLLSKATQTEHHEFWTCAISLVDSSVLDPTRVHGPRQVTDAYLLALATSQGGRLVTFDQHISLSAVPNATADNLVVL